MITLNLIAAAVILLWLVACGALLGGLATLAWRFWTNHFGLTTPG